MRHLQTSARSLLAAGVSILLVAGATFATVGLVNPDLRHVDATTAAFEATGAAETPDTEEASDALDTGGGAETPEATDATDATEVTLVTQAVVPAQVPAASCSDDDQGEADDQNEADDRTRPTRRADEPERGRRAGLRYRRRGGRR